MHVSPRLRIWIVTVLAACAVALIVLTRLTGRAGSSQGQRASPQGVRGEMRTISGQVEAVAAAFNIPRGAMRLPSPTRHGLGVPEMRLKVRPEFSILEFHSALVGALAELDATVVGTEHLREKTVSLQILKDGSPVMLVILDLHLSPQQQRKESHH